MEKPDDQVVELLTEVSAQSREMMSILRQIETALKAHNLAGANRTISLIGRLERLETQLSDMKVAQHRVP